MKLRGSLPADSASCGAHHPPLRCTPSQVVAAWNGMAIGALAAAGRVLALQASPEARHPLWPVEGCLPATYLQAATKVSVREGGQGVKPPPPCRQPLSSVCI